MSDSVEICEVCYRRLDRRFTVGVCEICGKCVCSTCRVGDPDSHECECVVCIQSKGGVVRVGSSDRDEREVPYAEYPETIQEEENESAEV